MNKFYDISQNVFSPYLTEGKISLLFQQFRFRFQKQVIKIVGVCVRTLVKCVLLSNYRLRIRILLILKMS